MESSQRFFDWAFKARAKHVIDMYNGVMESKEKLFLNFCSHEPAFVSYGPAGINASVKGVGFLPKDEYLEETLEAYDEDAGGFEGLTAKHWCYVDLEGNPLTQDGTFEGENDYQAVEEYYDASPEDYMAVRIELYDDVRWSDGEKLTVEDGYYTFDVATDNVLSNYAGALAWTADL